MTAQEFAGPLPSGITHATSPDAMHAASVESPVFKAAPHRHFPGRTVALLDAAPGLRAGVSAAQQVAARDLLVETRRLRPGAWHAREGPEVGRGHLGLLILDGLMSRELHVAGSASVELLGPGDLIRPWRWDAADDLLPLDARWSVLSPATVALLDRHVAAGLSHSPEVIVWLLDRVAERSERVATGQAIAQLTGVDRRILALFVHLAARWGRVSGDGIVVPLALTHRLLGQLVGASRPTISAALKRLAERGELLRSRDGSWLLPRRRVPGLKGGRSR
jgi:CRP/FNR family transcriptional regulator, cyclic AMP receptor protein